MSQISIDRHREAVKSRFAKNLSQLTVHVGSTLDLATIREVEHGKSIDQALLTKYVEFVEGAAEVPQNKNRTSSRMTIEVRRFIEGEGVSVHKEIGDALLKYNDEKRITLVNLAMLLGCSIGPVMSIINGKMKPHKSLKYIARNIEVDGFVKTELSKSTHEETKALLESGSEAPKKVKKAKSDKKADVEIDYTQFLGQFTDMEGHKVTLTEPVMLISGSAAATEILRKVELNEADLSLSALRAPNGDVVIAIQGVGTKNVKE